SVRFTNAENVPVANGLTVTGSVNPSSVGNVFGVDASGAVTTSATAPTAGGNANFRFIGQSPGTATVTFSAPDPSAAGRTVTTAIAITVTEGPTRLSIDATRDTLPINAF